MGDLLKLAERVEVEPASMEMWFAAWLSTGRMLSLDDGPKFSNLVIAGAYLDAADMLRPEGWLVDVSEWPSGSYDTFEARLVRESDYDAKANISETEVTSTVKRGPHAEARARLAAALRAHATGGGNG